MSNIGGVQQGVNNSYQSTRGVAGNQSDSLLANYSSKTSESSVLTQSAILPNDPKLKASDIPKKSDQVQNDKSQIEQPQTKSGTEGAAGAVETGAKEKTSDLAKVVNKGEITAAAMVAASNEVNKEKKVASKDNAKNEDGRETSDDSPRTKENKKENKKEIRKKTKKKETKKKLFQKLNFFRKKEQPHDEDMV